MTIGAVVLGWITLVLPVLLLSALTPPLTALLPVPSASPHTLRPLHPLHDDAMVLHVHQTADEVGAAVGALILELSKTAIAANGRFTLALSGGSLPKVRTEEWTRFHSAFFRRSDRVIANQIMNKGLKQIQGDVNYSKWFVYFADERCVPLDSDDSNYKACKEALFDHVRV